MAGRKFPTRLAAPTSILGLTRQITRQVFGDDFLYAVVQILALGVVQSDELLLHQAIHFGFPRRGWFFLARVPEVSFAAR